MLLYVGLQGSSWPGVQMNHHGWPLAVETNSAMPVACSTETEVAVELQSLMFVTALDTVTVKC